MASVAGSEVISIIDADPDLGGLLDAAEREQARRDAVTGVRRLPPSQWKAVEALEADVQSRRGSVLGVARRPPGGDSRPWPSRGGHVMDRDR
jgi:hypothetical protein